MAQQRKLEKLTAPQMAAKINELSAAKTKFMIVLTDETPAEADPKAEQKAKLAEQANRFCARRSARLQAIETSRTMYEMPVFRLDMTSPRAGELLQQLVDDTEEPLAAMKLGGVVVLSWDAAGRVGCPHTISPGIGTRIQIEFYNACRIGPSNIPAYPSKSRSQR